jgi:hypothetical protein
MRVLTIGYPGRTRQFSLRGEQVDQVRRWLGNYHTLKEAIEAICELNHALQRPEDASRARSRRRKAVDIRSAEPRAQTPKRLRRRKNKSPTSCSPSAVVATGLWSPSGNLGLR